MPNYICPTCGPRAAAQVVEERTCATCGGEVLKEGIIEMTFMNPAHTAIRIQGTGSAGERLPCVETALTGKSSSLRTAISSVMGCMAHYGYVVAVPEAKDIHPYTPPPDEPDIFGPFHIEEEGE